MVERLNSQGSQMLSGAEEDPYNGSWAKLAQQGRADSADEGCASSGLSHLTGQPLTGGTVEEDSSDEGCSPHGLERIF